MAATARGRIGKEQWWRGNPVTVAWGETVLTVHNGNWIDIYQKLSFWRSNRTFGDNFTTKTIPICPPPPPPAWLYLAPPWSHTSWNHVTVPLPALMPSIWFLCTTTTLVLSLICLLALVTVSPFSYRGSACPSSPETPLPNTLCFLLDWPPVLDLGTVSFYSGTGDYVHYNT